LIYFIAVGFSQRNKYNPILALAKVFHYQAQAMNFIFSSLPLALANGLRIKKYRALAQSSH
jgi:hypothetical protein